MTNSKLVLTIKKTTDGSKYGLQNRTLEVYETKTQYKAVLWNSGVMFWKEVTKPLRTETFKKKDATIEDVIETLGFSTK